MKKLILLVVLLSGCLGHQKGVIILKNGNKVNFNSFVMFDEKSYFVSDKDCQYIVNKKQVKKIVFEE